MEPVETNAGARYLRALRADERLREEHPAYDRVDDRLALAELGETDAGYIARRVAHWESDAAY